MVNRASGPLFLAYLFVIASGVFFLVAPSPILAQVTDYGELLIVWGMFYLIGGVTAVTSLLFRMLLKNSVPLWYFETAGIALIVTANLVYAYALARLGLETGEFNLIALSGVLLAFSSGLFARCIESLRFIALLKRVYASLEE